MGTLDTPVTMTAGETDVESGKGAGEKTVLSKECASTSTAPSLNMEPGTSELVAIREKSSILAKLRAAELWLDKKLKLEPMGIERVREDERRPPKALNMMFLWFSLLMTPGMLTITSLGPILGLSVADSLVVTVVGTVVGGLFPALTATYSPLTGLRQVAMSRYVFGIQGSKICAVLNLFVNIGYGVIGCILSGQLLQAVSGGGLNISVGIVVVVVLGFFVSFLGYHFLQHYDRYAWAFVAVILVVHWAQAARYFPADITYHELQGEDYVGVGLTYFAIIFGQCVAWSSVAGDYYVHYPVNVSRVKVFALTWLGQTVPTLFVGLLGVYLGGALYTNADVGEMYETGGIGAVILGTMRPAGFSKFVGIVYVFSFIANLSAILYSSALSVQIFGTVFFAVPRFLWVLLASAATLALSLGGRNVFQHILENLLPLLGYWTICFATTLAIEHYIFRPRLGGYDLDGWRDSKRTPLGLAGVATMCLAIGLSFLGMNQTWYVSPLAKLIGIYGGDVADYITMAVSLLFYPALRYLEIKYIGR